MSYRTRILPTVSRSIASWGLPDEVLVEVHLRLREDLPSDPRRLLMRTVQPFDGLTYSFDMIDPGNRLRQHIFDFQVLYHPDEQTLLIVRGGYRRTEGL